MAIQDLIRLERMSYDEKIAYWSRKDAFKKPDGGSIRFPQPRSFNRSQVEIDGGNITKVPPFFGRPCFGIPTAYLRHYLRPFGRARDGRLIENRCARCQIADACKLAATERLNASPKLMRAHRSFELAGGTRAMWNTKGSKHWRSPWLDLKDALKDHGSFTSVNDDFVAEECVRLEAKHRADTRERKRKERKRLERQRAKEGEFTEDLLAALVRHRIYRRVRYVEALEGGSLQGRSFSKLPADGPQFDTAVWQAKAMLVFRDREPKAYTVAKEMIDQSLWDHDNVNSLRQRVKKALERIRKLERTEMADGPAVFPRLTLASLIKEIADDTPYEN